MVKDKVIISGNSNRALAQEICDKLEIPLGKAVVETFSDGEILVEIGESVRGKDVFIIQSTCPPVNNNLQELLIMIDAAKRASASRVTAVMPYYGYARQDRKNKPRVPISARAVADQLEAVGTDRILTMDLHADQIQGFFRIPVDNLIAKPVIAEHIRNQFPQIFGNKRLKTHKHIVIVSPDAGGTPRAWSMAEMLGAGLAIMDKRRTGKNKATIMHLIGKVKKKIAIVLDDMADTAGTLTEAASTLLKRGALSVHGCCVHPVLSGPALEKIKRSKFKSLAVTNTIPLRDNLNGRIQVLSVADLFGRAILEINIEGSVSKLF